MTNGGAPRVYLVNRMFYVVAYRVKEFMSALFNTEPRESDPETLPVAGVDVLIVGRQHQKQDGTFRYGYEVLHDAVRRGQPSTVIYVVPSLYDPKQYRRDRAALSTVSTNVPLFVLEFPKLRQLAREKAIQLANTAITRGLTPWDDAQPPRLLP